MCVYLCVCVCVCTHGCGVCVRLEYSSKSLITDKLHFYPRASGRRGDGGMSAAERRDVGVSVTLSVYNLVNGVTIP